MSKYLLEIGVEEFPASYIEPTRRQLIQQFEALFEEHGVPFHSLTCEATPRRFVVRVDGLHNRTEEKVVEVRGPQESIAFDEEGKPSKALAGFARGQGVDVDALFRKEVKGTTYLFAEKKEGGRDVKQILAESIPGILRVLTFPKSMKWGGRDFRFARPIRWFVSLFDDAVLPFEMEGIPVDRYTRGHRVLGSDNIEIKTIDSFEDALLANYVMLSSQKRREVIRANAERLVREQGGNLTEDEDLMDEIVHLVEYPTPLLGRIPTEYMDLPDPVILTPMREHLRYMPVVDDRGETMPFFVTVRNGDKTGMDTVREGNERVLTPRLEDAKFFYNEDRAEPLEAYVEKLKTLTFHDKLGNMYEKTMRVRKLAEQFGEALQVGDGALATIERAATLAKADLMTRMVIEFTELQGVIGGIYAQESGETDGVAKAITEHYLPKTARGDLPQTTGGMVLALADKMDTLCGLFAAGEKVTGSQDPFGLRRLALGVLDILIANRLNLSLSTMVRDSLYLYVDEKVMVFPYEETRDRILRFFEQRLKNRLTEDGYRYDVFDSVMASRPYQVHDLILRLSAVEDFLAIDQSASIVQSLSRMSTLAEKAESDTVDEELLTTQEEKDLYTLGGEYDAIHDAFSRSAYKEGLTLLAKAAPVVDAFLDNTMVMVDDLPVRANRLALLARANRLVTSVFSPDALILEG